MKLYTRPPDLIIRVWIKKTGCEPQYLSLCDCKDRHEALSWFKAIVLKDTRIIPFVSGLTTNVQFREALGAKNGLAVSVSFRGLDPLEVKELIIKNLTE